MLKLGHDLILKYFSLSQESYQLNEKTRQLFILRVYLFSISISTTISIQHKVSSRESRYSVTRSLVIMSTSDAHVWEIQSDTKVDIEFA